MMEGINVSRRGFLGGATAFAAVQGRAGNKEQSKKLRFAAIGIMGMGRHTNPPLVEAGAELVAICDVDKKNLEEGKKRWPGVPAYLDYRKMLKEIGHTFDAVNITTPDSTHAYIAIECMNYGKHVYVQKPLARTFEECDLMLEAQRRTGVVCQMGNQNHPTATSFSVVKAANFWGEIKHIDGWSDRPIWPQGMTQYPKPLPWDNAMDATQWDIWCGPCVDHGYSKSFHQRSWRAWWDYGCGAIGDMAVHNVDAAFCYFDLGYPVEIEGDTCGAGPVTVAYPKKSVIKMKFANGVTFHWYDGGNKPELPKGANPSLVYPSNGLVVHGSRATTLGARPVVIAAGDGENAEKRKELSRELKEILKPHKIYNHYKEFVDACLAGDPKMCGSNLEYAAPFTQVLLLGCLSLRFPGKKLKFDPKTKQFTNCPEANEFLKAPKRGDWDFAKIATSRPWWKFW